jgi:thioredoxin-dependent peroxiredoxin
MMNLKINDIAPDFVAETTQGTIRLHDWMQEDWVVLFSHPKVFTRICTSELSSLALNQNDFVKRNVKLIGVGADPVSSQTELANHVRRATGARVNFPIIGDPNLEVLSLYNMLASDTNPANATVRSVFLIGPDKRIRLMLAYPREASRDFNEILRVIDSISLTALYNTPMPEVDETSRGFPGFRGLFAFLRHEILSF